VCGLNLLCGGGGGGGFCRREAASLFENLKQVSILPF
jgi:hypothetical protein